MGLYFHRTLTLHCPHCGAQLVRIAPSEYLDLAVCPACSQQSASVISKASRSRCLAGVVNESAIVVPRSANWMAAGQSFNFLEQSAALMVQR